MLKKILNTPVSGIIQVTKYSCFFVCTCKKCFCFEMFHFLKIKDELKKLKYKFQHLMKMDHIGRSFEGRPLLQVHVSILLLKLCYMMMMMMMMMMMISIVMMLYRSYVPNEYWNKGQSWYKMNKNSNWAKN